MKRILLVLIISANILLADLSRDANGIVSDSTSALQWQDNTTPTLMNWNEAISYCEALDLDGGAWRLPNINELTSLVDDTKIDPAIYGIFQNTISNDYWSSTTDADNSEGAWIVHFSYGGQGGSYKTNDNYVRCVRAGQ
ncbi:MAG: DUF1566 domain-containing protein [Campylobacterota bacterium]|nr:DUF1566 domain-containing protein [Campylobacterota bacterium]